ncbi:hypothetical protein CASFOL_001383 [Castilleja foliolosa]|uniref:Uncharacterized protein n=1 Tax=Castilleja foliolosa TaxID=1961234 RepID=A0ABD3EPE8_9LAMI
MDGLAGHGGEREKGPIIVFGFQARGFNGARIWVAAVRWGWCLVTARDCGGGIEMVVVATAWGLAELEISLSSGWSTKSERG